MKANTVLLVLLVMFASACGSTSPTSTSIPTTSNTVEESNKYFEAGNAHFQAGEYVPAIEDYTQVIRLVPDTSGAYYNRGLAYGYLKECSTAKSDFDQAYKLSSNDAEIRQKVEQSLSKLSLICDVPPPSPSPPPRETGSGNLSTKPSCSSCKGLIQYWPSGYPTASSEYDYFNCLNSCK